MSEASGKVMQTVRLYDPARDPANWREIIRPSQFVAVALLALAPVLFWIDWAKYDGTIVVPTVAGINCIIFAARIFLLNGAHASAERASSDS